MTLPYLSVTSSSHLEQSSVCTSINLEGRWSCQILEHLDGELLLLRLTGSYGAPKTGTIYCYVEGCVKEVLRRAK